MSASHPHPRRPRGVIVATVVVIVVLLGGVVSYPRWLPWFNDLLAGQTKESHDEHDYGSGASHSHDSEAAHVHDAEAPHGHDGPEEANWLELSDVAWKNIGLETGVIEPQRFVRTVSVPARVVERPGRSQVEITAPLTGIVIRIHAFEGEAVQPGQPLFDLRLTHEDLVKRNATFSNRLRSVM